MLYLKSAHALQTRFEFISGYYNSFHRRSHICKIVIILLIRRGELMDTRNNKFKLDFMPIGQDIKQAREAKDVTREQLGRQGQSQMKY
mgnify:CR=1 FL=1